MGKLDKQQQILIAVAAGFIFGIYLYWTQLLKPTMDAIKIQKTEYADLLDKIGKAERQAKRLPALKAEKEKLEVELAALEKQLPRQQDTPNIIRILTQEALSESLDFDRLTPKPIESRNYFQVIPFEIQFSGGLHALVRFLASLGQQDRIFQAQNIRLTPLGAAEGAPLSLTISLTIMTYAYSGGA